MFTKEIFFTPAYDMRDPDPAKNYGIGAVKINFVLTGSKGVVCFLMSSGWYLPSSHVSLEIALRPMGFDLGYHSPKKMFKGQTASKCGYLPKGECYYDGSTLNSEPVLLALIEKGDIGVWEILEEYYKTTFKSEK